MANLVISGGTTSAGLIAGGAATGADYQSITVLSAAVDPSSSIIDAAHAVVDTANNKTTYIGKLTVATAANYFAAGSDTGAKDLLLEVADGTHSGVVAAGAAAGGTVGTGKVKVTNRSAETVVIERASMHFSWDGKFPELYDPAQKITIGVAADL